MTFWRYENKNCVLILKSGTWSVDEPITPTRINITKEE